MPILVVFLAVGFGETVGQVLLIRELLINFQGNELSLGVILACWLLVTALGSWGLGRYAEKLPAKSSLFVFTVILYALVLITQLLLARGVSAIIGVEPGEVAGLASMFYACLLVLTPLCLLHGFQFPLACRILAVQKGEAPVQVGRVYIAEALGGVAGGALFTYFLVQYFDHLEIAVFTVILNLAASLFLLTTWLSVRFLLRKIAVGALILAAVICLSTGLINKLDHTSSQWQWRGHELVSSRNTLYQNIAVTMKAAQLNFFANGVLLFTTPVPDIKFVEDLSHFPLLHHPSPQNVLVIGGGMGGVLEEIIKHPVDSIIYVEPDPRLISIAEEYLPASPLLDPRIKVNYTDGRLFVETTGARFDTVIMNLPPPSTLQINRFYTLEFFEAVQGILNNQGILAFGVPASEAFMSEEMINLNQGLFSTLREVFPAITVIPGDFTLFLASPGPAQVTVEAGEIYHRLEERRIQTRLFTSQYIEHQLRPERVSRLGAYLYETGEMNQDHRPVSTFHNLALWNAMFQPELRNLFAFALEIKLWWFLPVLLIFFAPFLIRLRKKKTSLSPVVLAIFTTGFAGMTFTMVLLFTFQIFYGHLYQKIGILVAAFMLGLALGGWTMNWIMGKLKNEILTLALIVLAVTLYAFLLYWLVLGVKGIPVVPGEVPFASLNLAAGFLAGLQFPLASRIYLQRTGRVAPAVGWLYAADLWGAVLAALLASVLLIPTLGIMNTCFLAGIISLVSFVLLIISSKTGYPKP